MSKTMDWREKRIILASQSPRRLDLLRQIGIEPVVDPSTLPESVETEDPAELVQSLSVQKAVDVASRHAPEDIVIGADTVVSVDGRILGKPHSHEEAAAMIRLLAGRTHQVYTGVTLVSSGRLSVFCERTDVHVAQMSEDEIRDYAYSSEPMDKAGAYGIQGGFARFISRIEGDYANVVGLPVARLYQELKTLT